VRRKRIVRYWTAVQAQQADPVIWRDPRRTGGSLD
jgi:hypothetical protein